MARRNRRQGLRKRAWREAKKIAKGVAREGARQAGDILETSAEIMGDVALGVLTLGMAGPTNGNNHRR